MILIKNTFKQTEREGVSIKHFKSNYYPLYINLSCFCSTEKRKLVSNLRREESKILFLDELPHS